MVVIPYFYVFPFMRSLTLSRTTLILFFLFIVFATLYFAKAFFIPFTIAGILAMLFLPLSKKLEGKGVNRGFAAVISIFIILLFFALVIGMVVWQVQDLAKDKDKVQQQITQKIELLKKAVDKKLGISPKKQEEMLKEQQQSSKGNIGQTGSKIFTSLFSFL